MQLYTSDNRISIDSNIGIDSNSVSSDDWEAYTLRYNYSNSLLR